MQRTLYQPSQSSHASSLLWAIGGLGALGLWLGMANPLVHFPALVFLYPASLAFLGLTAPTLRSALRRGWLTGLCGSSACLYWIAVPVHEVAKLPLPLAIPCVLALGAYMAVYSGLFAALARFVRPLPSGTRALTLGLGWFLLEWLRGGLFTGFPWLSLAAAFAPWPVMLQGLSVVGAYGLGGFFAGLACLAGFGASLRARVVAAVLLAALVGFGFWRMHTPIATAGEPLTMALVQGNVDQNVKWEPAGQRATVDHYVRLSARALAAQPEIDLLVWPETSMPFDFTRHRALAGLVRDFTTTHHTSVVMGSVGRDSGALQGASSGTGLEAQKTGQVTKKGLYNRAYLVNKGADAGWYEKEHLVPFGEYLPQWLDFSFLQPLLQGIGDFTPGNVVLPLPYVRGEKVRGEKVANSSENKTFSEKQPEEALVLGLLICYETIFPELARERVAQGAELLINVSNDAWFGFTAAPQQHLNLTLLRAVEQGRYVARATNTGLTAFIDPYGRVRRQGGMFEPLVLTDAVPLVREKTLFFYVAPWLPAGAGLVFGWLLFPLLALQKAGIRRGLLKKNF